MIKHISPIKARRINVKSNKSIFGKTPIDILESFNHYFNNSHKYVRIYTVPKGNTQRVIIKANTKDNSQILFEVKTYKNNIMFEPMGVFDENFSHRLIRDKSLRNKGLGTKALKSERALKRATKKNQAQITTNQKSLMLLLLKKGYKINKTTSAKAMRYTRTKNEKELIEYLKKIKDPDPIIMEFKFEKP
jgi:hypothetical protein